MGLFVYTQKGSIISMVDLPTTEIIEPFLVHSILHYKILEQINLACESIFVEFYSFSPVIFGIINPVYLKLK
ncbi:hypothetical protein EI220_10245 [Streptococcus suis]|uniref:Uncharacterized protein n=1 Tax=Streptococcus suis TaxID=1307 RepID=A0A426G1X5_STRSU|nr:hypothetical protein EI220_10245 [Streptococcus suis]